MGTMGAMSKTVAAMAGVVMALGVASPAQADVRRFSDARGDTRSSVDILSVRVDNSTADRREVRVRIRHEDLRLGHSITVYLDTRPADPGPEFAISGAAGSEYILNRTEGWKHMGRMVRPECGYSMRIHEGTEATRVIVRRGCIGKPGKVRVAVRAQRDGTQAVDWAASRRTFLDFVGR
jgi:hypothetical protein